MIRLKNRKIVVVGLGKSGFASAKFLAEKGAIVRVTEGSENKEVFERAGYLKGLGVSVEVGGHTESFIAGSDFLVVSPGVPKKSMPLTLAAAKKIPVISEVELAYYFCKGPIAAITGSNGKTTTSHLLHRMLLDAGKKSVLCGNVGTSFLDAIPSIDSKTVVVLELSSFQLEDSPRLKPRIAAILNVTPNHLDRHGSFEAYTEAKERIFRNQTVKDTLILNYDDPIVRAMADRAPSSVIFFSKSPVEEGICLEKRRVIRKSGRQVRHYFKTDRFGLKGAHNLENILAAAAAAGVFGVEPVTMKKTLEAFRTLEHRVEPLGEIGGVSFVNDSKSTTVSSTRAAVLSVEGSLVLVAGGRDKGVHFAAIEPLLEEKVKTVVLYGEAAHKIAGSWRLFKRFLIVPRFEDAVREAYRLAARGDTLLLSPMCASFDQFGSFEERGEAFKKVFALLGSEKSE
ncbi:MAG: UDP-N-acetylmuramoyl-L-alanine--D-glutamate ligase [Candidatus Omnitrophica bacterium]|nr:UDP-N-acetylmuramoyl-L-alanine--D-glutamate ligase [Candidatus Omnitrophota bacterium]